MEFSIPVKDLIKGIKYRIKHKRSNIEREGTFVKLFPYPSANHAQFSGVTDNHGFSSPSSTYSDKDWTFREINSKEQIYAVQSLGRQRKEIPNTAITEIGRFVTHNPELARVFKNDDDANEPKGASVYRPPQPNQGAAPAVVNGGRRRKTKKSKRRSRKTRRSRK